MEGIRPYYCLFPSTPFLLLELEYQTIPSRLSLFPLAYFLPHLSTVSRFVSFCIWYFVNCIHFLNMICNRMINQLLFGISSIFNLQLNNKTFIIQSILLLYLIESLISKALYHNSNKFGHYLNKWLLHFFLLSQIGDWNGVHFLLWRDGREICQDSLQNDLTAGLRQKTEYSPCFDETANYQIDEVYHHEYSRPQVRPGVRRYHRVLIIPTIPRLVEPVNNKVFHYTFYYTFIIYNRHSLVWSRFN